MVVVGCPGNALLCGICDFLSHQFNVFVNMPEHTYVKQHKHEMKHTSKRHVGSV